MNSIFPLINSPVTKQENLESILIMLVMILVFSLYEFFVYKVVSHNSIYNKSFHVTLLIIPFFVGSIIYALQTNALITLGTIGALAIIRYRTAVKDPTDMLYILWSIFNGICCGCELYILDITTSLFVTLVLVAIELFGKRIIKNPYVLVVNCVNNEEETLLEIIKKYAKHHRVKSRNFTKNSVDYVIQLETKDPNKLVDAITESGVADKYSLIEYDTEDVL